jgi:phospholipase A1
MVLRSAPFHRLSITLAAIAALGFSCAARAQDSGADCVRIDDDAARLVCYDRVHKRAVVPAGIDKPSSLDQPGVAPTGAATQPPPGGPAPSLYDDRWDLDGRRKGELFFPRAHKPVYALPVTWTDQVNVTPSSPSPGHSVDEPLVLRPIEVKYQLSLKAKLWEGVLGTPLRVWGGYTQSSRWQVYNGHESRPFRETNYEPEIIFAWPLDRTFWGWRLRQLSLSVNHQSNGRALPLSRSWNRVIGEAALERGEWTMQVRPWVRMNERPTDDDNPDISDHVGRGELLFTGKLGRNILALTLRHSLRGASHSRGSALAEWSFPIDGALHAYVQWFGGYGESMIDYNHRQSRLGVGVSIVEWR